MSTKTTEHYGLDYIALANDKRNGRRRLLILRKGKVERTAGVSLLEKN